MLLFQKEKKKLVKMVKLSNKKKNLPFRQKFDNDAFSVQERTSN